ncbi:Cyclic nucleotide-binding protein [Pseudocohnilembus persalinus]|uniref:Cyclic nucleotide-binding protein n=1 Tax=Pseudocohnilembus persalinus TaxID=266149 RepID=A0A0V0Q967_PSEPJ|nr:Cyclic nucleotide-binding protein [Pseudocohnilembus persalinus]|eukprot:KRW98750.1 Cyclic nucleotide-binding protein [Pseudocohnilembus persalinus]
MFGTQTWINQRNQVDQSNSIIYLDALYFSAITMITVGYGDIYPYTPQEKIYTIIMTIFACGVFAYAVNVVGNIFQEKLQKESLRKNEKFQLLKYLQNQHVSQQIQQQSLQYLDFIHQKDKENENLNGIALLSKLSPNLKNQILKDMYLQVLQQDQFLKMNFSTQILSEIAVNMKEKVYAPGEYIQQQDIFDERLIFLIKGEVSLIFEKEIFQSHQQKCQIKDNYHDIKFDDQKTFIVCNNIQQKYLMCKEDMEQQIINCDKCFICNIIDHNIQSCPLYQLNNNKTLLIAKNNYSQQQERQDIRKSKRMKGLNALWFKQNVQLTLRKFRVEKVFQQEYSFTDLGFDIQIQTDKYFYLTIPTIKFESDEIYDIYTKKFNEYHNQCLSCENLEADILYFNQQKFNLIDDFSDSQKSDSSCSINSNSNSYYDSNQLQFKSSALIEGENSTLQIQKPQNKDSSIPKFSLQNLKKTNINIEHQSQKQTDESSQFKSQSNSQLKINSRVSLEKIHLSKNNSEKPIQKNLNQKTIQYFCSPINEKTNSKIPNEKQTQNKGVKIDLDDKLQEEELMFNEKNKELLSGVEDYEKALQFFQIGKYRISLEFFKRVLANLENSQQKNTLNYVLVLKKIVLNQNMLRLYQDSEHTLEQIIEITQKASTSDALLYREYHNLFLHLLRTNLNKSIILGKALLSQNEIKNIPVIYQKYFQFNLGTAYLLKGNFVDAKRRLRECLVMKPNNQLKGYALNNLAVASWWHKHPNFRDEEDEMDDEGPVSPDIIKKINENEEYSFEQIDKDFENVIPLLKRALYNLEDVEKIKDLAKKLEVEDLLDSEQIIPKDFQKLDPSLNMLLTKKDSGVPLLNIQEFLFNTSPEKRNEATYWFKYALKHFEQVNPSNIDRCLITLAIFCSSSNQPEKAEGLFKKVLQMLEDSDSFNKVLCLQLYGNLLKKNADRYKEGEALIAQAYELSDILPFWSNKLVHVCIPDLEV